MAPTHTLYLHLFLNSLAHRYIATLSTLRHILTDVQYKFRFSNKDHLTFNQKKSAPQNLGLWACFSALQLRVITVVLLTHLVWISYAVIWRGKAQCQPSYIRQSRVPHADHDWKYTWWILNSVLFFVKHKNQINLPAHTFCNPCIHPSIHCIIIQKWCLA